MRENGVTVVEYEGNYGHAVAQGRKEAEQCLALMQQSEGIQLEPSALAGALGFERVMGPAAESYRVRLALDETAMSSALHLIWGTGGGMVPEAEYAEYLNKGQILLGV